ncbi:MAG TPA: YIP1 family protein [Anaeromyxobacteraceae bacterium]|nr:YIP1 family protein [Anaeromyxobacteraceae bacterium]
MPSPEIAIDGSVILETFLAPARGLARAVERRRSLVALVVATALALGHAAAAAPRLDVRREVTARLDRSPEGADMTPHQREEAVATARRVAVVGVWAGAALSPSFLAVLAAVFLWLGFRVAGTAPAFRPTLSAVAHGMLPVWVGGFLAIPALLAREAMGAEELSRLLPSDPTFFLPPGAPPAALAALGALDLFHLWGLVLVAGGMARVSGATRRRAAAVTVVLWLAYVALFQIVPAAARGGP